MAMYESHEPAHHQQEKKKRANNLMVASILSSSAGSWVDSLSAPSFNI
jgi:hypothetical protein